MINRTLTGNWRLSDKERVWGRPWVIVEVEERVVGQLFPRVPCYVHKKVWRPATLDEAVDIFDKELKVIVI